MRRWGVVISLVYALILLGFLYPLGVLLVGGYNLFSAQYYRNVAEGYGEPVLWLPIGLLILGQVALLFVPVDLEDRRLKPRGPLVRSAVIASMLFMILSFALILCVSVALKTDQFLNGLGMYGWFVVPGGLWAGWAIVFYLNLRGKTEIAKRVTTWLLRGSVLELLIAVPCHVIVRRRNECCAPIVTSLGITAGIAVMLLSFGPSVLLMYKKRMEERRAVGQQRKAAV